MPSSLPAALTLSGCLSAAAPWGRSVMGRVPGAEGLTAAGCRGERTAQQPQPTHQGSHTRHRALNTAQAQVAQCVACSQRAARSCCSTRTCSYTPSYAHACTYPALREELYMCTWLHTQHYTQTHNCTHRHSSHVDTQLYTGTCPHIYG